MSTPDTKPRRKRRPWLILIPVILLAAIGGAMAYPDSPIYLAKLLSPEIKIENRSRSEWVADLSSADKEQRVKAASALGKMNDGGKKALPDLMKAIQNDKEADVRAVCADAATKMYPELGTDAAKAEYAAAVLEVFTAGLTDPDLRVRHNSALGLLKLKTLARPAVPKLLEVVKNEENDTNLNIYLSTVRQVMLRALGEAAAGTPDAVPAFVAILDAKLVPPAGVKLGRGGTPAKAMTDEQVEEMKAYNRGVITRRVVVTGLGQAGEHGRVAAPKIRELLKTGDEDDQFVSKEALERMKLPADGK